MTPFTKVVNVKADIPLRDFKPPIHGTCKNVTMTTGQILRCLCKRAIVDEVLPDGSTIRLNMSNYYLDNSSSVTTKTEVPAAEPEAKTQVVETRPDVNEEPEAVTEEVPEVVAEELPEDTTDAIGNEEAEDEDTDATEELEGATDDPQPATAMPNNNYNHRKRKKHR